MFRRENERLQRDKHRVQRELERKRVENDKIFQHKKDFDWMLDELFAQGADDQALVRKLLDALGDIRAQLEDWQRQLGLLVDADAQLLARADEERRQAVKRLVEKEAERQALEVQVGLLDSDMRTMRSGRLTSVRKECHTNQRVAAKEKRRAAQHFQAKVAGRKNAGLEAGRRNRRCFSRRSVPGRGAHAGQKLPSAGTAQAGVSADA